MVFMIPWDWAPLDYQRCAGQTLNLQQYAALYSLMGTRFGGNGSTTFALPNLQGRVPVGTGVSPASGAAYTMAATGGTEVSALTIGNLPAHNHTASFTPVLSSQTVTIPATTSSLNISASLPVGTTPPATGATISALANGQPGYLTGVSATVPNGLGTNPVTFKGPFTTAAPASGAAANLPVDVLVAGSAGTAATTTTISSIAGGTVTVNPTGSGQAFSNMQPYLAMNFIIAVNGLYPQRN
ncbi:tail fiber protein [Azospirillum sp. TSO35-2]|uniref:phage tail protein n=1 Tax=Azospirillum sp. TSO35-2 TaxID=716796 RepID=UPI001FFF6D55|nr:tail fiber protein [Azospirillum sp. TSO35-2]